jgi:PAS domain S-box-containing protein
MPLLLVWTAEPHQAWRRHQLSVAVPLGVAFVIVVVFFVYARASEQARIKLAFEQRTQTLAHTLRSSFDGYLDALHSVKSFHASTRQMQRHDFSTFVQHLFTRHPGIQALSWDRYIPDVARVAYEEAMQHEGYANFQITEQNAQGQIVRAAQRPEYVVVTHIEPHAGNASALGYDVASGVIRLAALQRARDTGEPSATSRVTLVQETSQQFGMLIFLPMYAKGRPHSTVQERRENLYGYATGVFRIDDMIKASLHNFALDGMVLQLYDETAPVGERLLYSRQWPAQGDTERLRHTVDEASATGLQWSTTFEMAGRRWVLQFSLTLAYFMAQRTWYTWAILACGMLFVGLLGAFLLILTGYTISTERLVAERTAANIMLEHEITARRQAEEALRESAVRYRGLFENANDILYTHDLQGNFTALNRMGEQLTGYSREDILTMNISQIVAPEHLELARQMITRQLAGSPATMYEVDIITRGGQRRPLEVSMQLISQAGTALGIQGIARDITERKRFEAQLRQAHKMEAVGTLAGGIAHDFNNILMAILGYTELTLQEVPEDSTTWHNLQAVRVAGKRAADLVHQILTFGRRTEQERQPIQLHSLIKETLKLLRATLPATIELRQVLDENPVTVLADPTQIHQVLINLCTNASQAMRQSGGILEVRLEALDLPTAVVAPPADLRTGPYIRLTVRDTGHGMKPETMERIFEPFFTTKGPGEGTGLGLSVVHGIIASHGGVITVASTQGQGTTFVVCLPQSEQRAAPMARPEEPVPRGHECLLLVDDEEALVRLGQAQLAQLGYEVVACISSVKALEVFQAAPQRFDLVITDQTMPQMTGEALTRALRHLRPDLPIILCTGFSDSMTAEKAQALGIDAFCTKPLFIHDLGRTIRQVLERRLAQKEVVS